MHFEQQVSNVRTEYLGVLRRTSNFSNEISLQALDCRLPAM